jgi:hypothetical protein
MRPEGEITAFPWSVGKADGDGMRLGPDYLPSEDLNTIDEDGVRLYRKDILLIPESHPYYNAGLLASEPTLNHRKVAKVLHQLYNKILKTLKQ